MKTKNKLNILLIEDDRMLVKMYVIKLEKEGFLVDVAINGIEGLKKLKNTQYDAVLLDLMMPEMDGFEMLKIYNNSDEYKKSPMIILSNLGQREDLEQAVKLGVEKENYLIKASMTPSDVINKIMKTIERLTNTKNE